MKRVAAILLILACLLPFCAAAEMVSISELKAQVPDYWDGSCMVETIGIPFHAPIYVPDVDKMPVIRAALDPLPQEGTEGYEKMIQENLPGRHKLSSGLGRAKRGEWFSEFLHSAWQEDYDRNSIFAENQELSLGEMVKKIEAFAQQLYGDDISLVPNRVELMSADRVVEYRGAIPRKSDPYFDRGTLTGKGAYIIEAWTTLRGIPVIADIGAAQTSTDLVAVSELKRALQGALFFRGVCLMEYADENNWVYNNFDVYHEAAMLIEDIPLCSFEKVKNVVQEMIDAGVVRHVYSLQLGYVAYADPEIIYAQTKDEIDQQPMRLIPTWVVEVNTSHSSSTGRSMSKDGPAIFSGRHTDKGYEVLFIDAQTGEILNQQIDKSSDAFLYAKEVLMW